MKGSSMPRLAFSEIRVKQFRVNQGLGVHNCGGIFTTVSHFLPISVYLRGKGFFFLENNKLED